MACKSNVTNDIFLEWLFVLCCQVFAICHLLHVLRKWVFRNGEEIVYSWLTLLEVFYRISVSFIYFIGSKAQFILLALNFDENIIGVVSDH